MACRENVVGLAASNCLQCNGSATVGNFRSVLAFPFVLITCVSVHRPRIVVFTEEENHPVSELGRKHRSSFENKKTDAVPLRQETSVPIPSRVEIDIKALDHCTVPSDCFCPTNRSLQENNKRVCITTRTPPHGSKPGDVF